MENSKIPKPGRMLKPPGIFSRPLAPISENQPTTSNSITKNAYQPPKFQPRGLRRRSKSASDLRSLTSKPQTTKAKPFKPFEKLGDIKPFVKPGTTSRVAEKRSATQINEDESKPKKSKVKIPDWDYKSRFQELQKKNNVHVEELKTLRSRVLNLPEIMEELETLRAFSSSSRDQIKVLSKQKETLEVEREGILRTNFEVKDRLAKQEQLCQKLKEEQEDSLHQINTLQKDLDESKSNNAFLTEKNEELERMVLQLKADLEEHDNLRRTLHNTIQDMKGTIRVFCRVRPPIGHELDKQLCWMFFPTDTTLEIRKTRESVSTISGKPTDLKQEFTFDQVFAPEANQSEVFEELAQLVQSALDGYHVCVFAYGQTGSGKTYTMQGSENDHGMIPRTIDLIFDKINKLKTQNWSYDVTASFLEIYNENIRDLLVPNSSQKFDLRYNEGRGVTVTNLSIVPTNSSRELKSLMEDAHKNRVVAATDFNEHSSRSHAVTTIHLNGLNNATNANYVGSINLVDLAGSESAKTSSAERLNETKNINKSLSTLGNVMLALHNQETHVPYRNSKLTFLLQSCLGGNSKTLMFVNISPFEECYGETINSLRFASKVKEVKMTAKKNKMYCWGASLPTKTV